jgi:hypothetical protein
MNWKNVLYLVRVERKSGRLIKGIKATRYRENSFIAYWPYWTALIIGVLGGLLAAVAAAVFYSHGVPAGAQPLNVEAVGFFAVLPTLVLVVSLVFTLFQQIQVAGVRPSGQVIYSMPVTWQEHAMASILANLLGWPAALVVGLTSGVIVFSVFNGLILQALLAMVILFATAFFASSITESLRIVQVRFTGAVYKSSGRAAIWVRFITYILIIIIFYILYFYLTSGITSFVAVLTAVQNSVWYIPFIWPALIISFLTKGLLLQGLIFLASFALLLTGFYYLAVELNKRFGLYEPPAITVQKSGIYMPKTGILGKLGFSSVEAALIWKDFRAFTRRRELISAYIFPIILIILGLFGVASGGGASNQTASPIQLALLTQLNVGWVFLMPASAMAMLLGESLIGEEGQAVWRIYASPISPKNLAKSKYFFAILFSIIILIISAAVGIVYYHPSLRKTIVEIVEAFLLVLALASVSLRVGFKGADFTESRRARMVRQEWSLIGLAVCAIAGAAVLAPVVAIYLLSLLSSGYLSSLILAIGVVISAAISIAISTYFYKTNIDSANDLLRKAEV